LDSENAACYVLLTNIYAAAGNGHLHTNVEQQWKTRGVSKQPGHTWIEVNNEVHMFVVDKQDHLKMIEICAELQRLSVIMCDAGYAPYTEFILHDVEEEEMVFHLCHQSEKLARIGAHQDSSLYSPNKKKSAGFFEDCHTSTKFI
jgi:hypothetical protein